MAKPQLLPRFFKEIRCIASIFGRRYCCHIRVFESAGWFLARHPHTPWQIPFSVIRSDPMAKNMSNDVVVARSALLALLFSFCAGQRRTARQWEVSIAPCILTLHETYSPFHSLLGQKVSRIFLPRRFLLRRNQTRSVVEFKASSHWMEFNSSFMSFISVLCRKHDAKLLPCLSSSLSM